MVRRMFIILAEVQVLALFLGCGGGGGPLNRAVLPHPEEAFPTSLHATWRGKLNAYYAPDGFFQILQKPVEQLPCLKCHAGTYADGTPVDTATYSPSCKDCHICDEEGKPDLTKPVPWQQCFNCHIRGVEINLAPVLGYKDVHWEKGLRCMNCHTLREMHGDGKVYPSYLAPGAMDAKCENCHSPAPTNVSHSIHNAKVHCTACHGKNFSCIGCHFPPPSPDVPPMGDLFYGFTLLMNRVGTNKVYPGAMMIHTYKGKSFVVVAPRGHIIAPKEEARKCDDCHGNKAIQEYLQTGKIVITKRGNGTDLENATGVIPLVPNWQNVFWFAFIEDVTPEAPSPTWTFMKEGHPDLTQMWYAAPLTQGQLQKLATLPQQISVPVRPQKAKK